MRRVHRTFLEHFRYIAIYECARCVIREHVPRPYVFHFGKETRCPSCGTLRVTRLKGRDRIDPMRTGFLNVLERLAGGKLFHCRFCRLQFYDRRQPAPEAPVPAAPDLA